MSTLQTITDVQLNVLRPNSNIVIYAKQYDNLSRLVNASLVAGINPWTIPNGVYGMVRYQKPDGTKGFYDVLEDGTTPAVTKTGASTIQIALAAQMLTADGVVAADVNFFAQDESRLTTLSFLINVEKGVPPDDTILSSDYFNILDRKINAIIGATTHPPQIDSTSKNWLLWDEDLGQYVDSGYSSKGTQGDPGVITVSTNIRYQEGTSPTTAPTGTWVTNPPNVGPGKYLWQRQIFTFGDGTISTAYLVARQGIDGSGSVSSVNNVSPDVNGNVALTFPVTSVDGGTGAVNTWTQRFLGQNAIATTADDTVHNWLDLGTGWTYYNENGTILGKPYTWGFLFNVVYGGDIFQLWKSMEAGDFYWRSGNYDTIWYADSWHRLSNSPRIGTISIPNNWTNTGNGYTAPATLSGTGFWGDSKIDLQPDSTVLSRLISDGCAALYIINNQNGTLTAYAAEAAPTTALAIQCTVIEVAS